MITPGQIIFDNLNADYGAAYDSNQGEIAFCQMVERLLPDDSAILDAGMIDLYSSSPFFFFRSCPFPSI